MPPVPDLSTVPLPRLLDLAGRVAVVTGGARGIGRACAARLAEAGAAVLAADVDLEAARTAAAELGPPAAAAEVDVRVEASLRALADRVLEMHDGAVKELRPAGER